MAFTLVHACAYYCLKSSTTFFYIHSAIKMMQLYLKFDIQHFNFIKMLMRIDFETNGAITQKLWFSV